MIVKVLPILDEIPEPATGLCLELNESSPHPYTYLRSKLILLFLYLGLPNGPSPTDFFLLKLLTHSLSVPCVLRVLSTNSVLFSPLIISGEGYKLSCECFSVFFQ